MNKLNFTQFRQKQFYTACTKNGGIICKSYNTIVAYITPYDAVYRVRYTHTTGKQITQFCDSVNADTYNATHCTAEELHNHIKAHEDLDINTNYNEAHTNN